MFLVDMISWWYNDGWKGQLTNSVNRLKSSADFFSIGQSIATLFEPFRQISADKIDGAINVVIQSFFDKLLSRFIGFIMRTFMIALGIIVMLSQIVFGVVIVILWFLIPFLPFVGLVLSILKVPLI